MTTMVILPLATREDFLSIGSNQQLVQNEIIWTPSVLDRLMVRATTALQTRCKRRMSAFTSKIESHTARGIDPNEFGGPGDVPLDTTGALGWSFATALGVQDMPRKFWLDEAAPMYPEWWSFNLESVTILRAFNDQESFGPEDFILWQGPEVDTGLVRMPVGTFCPLGSTIRVTYGGGYDPIPDDLNLACIYQAMKTVVLTTEPERRAGLSLQELDDEIKGLLGEYARY